MNEQSQKRVRSGLLLGAVLLGAPLVGCASQSRFEDLQATNRQLEESLQEVTGENDRLRDELTGVRRRSDSATGTLDELRDENDRLLVRVREADDQLRRLDRLVNSLPIEALDAETDRALQELASRNSDTIEYDRARGMLRFSSDLTFNSGSADVKDGARGALGELADVLDGIDLYELRIVGHTDAARPSAATARRFPTNTHLSVARAISVKQALTNAGVPSDRVLVAGWGPFRPIAEDGPNGNTPANRRVEIFLTTGEQTSAVAETEAAEDPVDPTK